MERLVAEGISITDDTRALGAALGGTPLVTVKLST